MKKAVIVLLIAIMCEATAHAGLGSKKTQYIGGTISQLKDGVEGVSSTKDENDFIFEYKGGRFALPYKNVTGIEYGQKAGRRVAVAILVTPLALFSKKRKHYLTLEYLDSAGKQQAGVFELGKDVIRVTLTSLEARTGKQIEYQDESARKAGRGN